MVVSICLNMIVKNESAIIRRLFDSVLPIIDTYCICDTGSTDNTKESQSMNIFPYERYFGGNIRLFVSKLWI